MRVGTACAAATVALWGCAPAPEPLPGLASQANLDAARMAGTWHEVAAVEPSACPAFSFGGSGACAVSLTPTGPGRLRLVEGGAAREEWVLWVDEAYRTAVLARPDGGGARIIDRSPGGAPDRLAAAESVLDFNGIDPARLTMPGRKELP